MEKEINLSYVITTFNKLNYLKVVLAHLIDNLESDEEIVVTDGGSTDGTKEYLEALFKEGKIHQFISEKDHGEAHGFNKGILMAKGTLIKLLSDDDVYNYDAIKVCKNFMLQNPKVELINTNGGWSTTKGLEISEFTKIYEDFFLKKWLVDGHPFAHCGLGLIIRKDALSKIGLLGNGFVRADAEFTLRYTNNKINIFWYTGIAYVRVLNDNSNSTKFHEKTIEETKRLNAFYGFDIDNIFFDKKGEENISGFDSLKEALKRIVNGFRNHSNKADSFIEEIIEEHDFNFLHENAVRWMKQINMRQNKFIGNEKNN